MDITDALLKDDHTTMLVYADWLEDEGHSEEAEAWRWIGCQGLTPFKDGSAGLRDVEFSHDWWNDNNRSEASQIPKQLFNLLVGGYKSNDNSSVFSNFHEYPTRQEAYEGLVDAYVRARRVGWLPNSPSNSQVSNT